MRSLFPVWAAATVLSVIVAISHGEKYELKVNLGGQRVNDFLPEAEVVQFEEGMPKTRYRGEMNGEPDDTDIEVFKTQRFSRNEDLYMHFPVPDGVYTITLLFAETFEGAFQAGGRLFDVYLGSKPNGIKKVISSLDVFSQVGGLKPLRRKFKGVASQDGVTLALRPIKQNPQIAGIIFEGHAYQKTFLDELPTVPHDPSQPLPDFEAVSRTGPAINPMEQLYDPQMNPKFSKEMKTAAASQGVPSKAAGQGPGVAPGMDAPTPGGSPGFKLGAVSSVAPSTGFGASSPLGLGGSPSAPSDSTFGAPKAASDSPFAASSPTSAFGASTSTASGGSNPGVSGSAFGESSSMNSVPSMPAATDSGFGATTSLSSPSSFGAPTGMLAGASSQSPSFSSPGLDQARNTDTASASSFLPPGAPGLSARVGLPSGPAVAQPRYTGRRRLLQENAQASMMQRIQTLNHQIADAQQHSARTSSQFQRPSEAVGIPEMLGRVRASIGSAPSMGSISAQGYSSETMPRYASIHQQMEHPGALPVSVRQVDGIQGDTPGAPGAGSSQPGNIPGGDPNGSPSGPGMPPLDPSQPPAFDPPSNPSPSDPMTPGYPGGVEAPGSDVPTYPRPPGAPEAPVSTGPGMPTPGMPGSGGDVTPGTPGTPFPDIPGSAGDLPPPGSDLPVAPGAQDPSSPEVPPQYPNAPEVPGRPGTVGDTPSPGSSVPGAPGAAEPSYPGNPPQYPNNPGIPDHPGMPRVSGGDAPPSGPQVPGPPGAPQAPAYPGTTPQYPDAPGTPENPAVPSMPIDAPPPSGMPIEANAQIMESPEHPGISRPGSPLNGVCINNSTHCSCGIAAPPESPEEQTCLFIVNETSSPKVCQKSKCNAQFICGCAEGAPMLCERKVARTILTEVDLHQNHPATSQANIVLCERIEIEERIDILEPTLAGY